MIAPIEPGPITGPSAIVQRMLEHKRLLIAQDAETVFIMASKWRELEIALEAETMLLATEIMELQRAGEVVHVNKLMKLERYQVLLGQLDIEMDKYSAWAETEIIVRERILGEMGLEHAVNAIQISITDATAEIGGVFNRVPLSAVENMIGTTSAGPLSELIMEAYPTAADRVTRALIDGVAMGRPPGAVAKAMADGMAEGLTRATTIARTEMLRVYREASRTQYVESGVVTGYERLASSQPNTCMACIALDGKVYPTGDLMEVHPNDRCTMIPLVKGAPPPERELAGDWFDRQTEEVQIEMMGPGTHELYKSGKIELKDLAVESEHPVWGPSLRVANTRDLK